MRLVLAIALFGGLVGCAIPVRFTEQPLAGYDKNTEYRIDEAPGGFVVNVSYARYQFIPESSAVQASCKSQVTSLAYETADKRGKKLQAIEDGRIKLSMGRNGFSGMTSCTASLLVKYLE